MKVDPSEFGPDEIFLSGRLQIETARWVLQITGINSPAIETFDSLIRAHDLAAASGGMDNLKYFEKSDTTEDTKADIILSARLASTNQAIPEDKRVAAEELLTILGVAK